MNIERREKYMGHMSHINKGNVKANINFDVNTLSLMCSYVISDNRNIRRGHLINMRNLFEIIDMSKYQSDPTRLRYIKFIRKALEAKLKLGLKNPNLVLKHINGGIVEDNQESSMSIEEFGLMNTRELEYVSQTISNALKYAYVDNSTDRLYDILTRYRATDYADRAEIVGELEQEIINLNNDFRRVRSQSQEEVIFSLREGQFEESMKDIHERLSNPSSRLFTGMKGFNKLIGGSFESGRTYMLVGLPGGGKSLTLLNLAKQIKMNNKHYKPKDPTKIPVIVYLTMENTVKENVERLFKLTTGKNMVDYSAEEAIEMMRDDELYLTDDNPIDILIEYKSDGSVDTSYLYDLTERLEEEGYEVICMIQDHVRRMHSVDRNKELRHELSNVSNEMKTFAMLKDLVFITNTHLNREAAKTIDDNTRSNKSDLIRSLGRSNVQESFALINNVDFAALIAIEFDEAGNKYMGFKRIKERFEVDVNFNIVYQPFVNPNSIAFIEDSKMRTEVHKNTLKSNNMNVVGVTNDITEEKYAILSNNDILGDNFNMFDYTPIEKPKNNQTTTKVNLPREVIIFKENIGIA